MAKKKKKNNIIAEVSLDGTIRKYGENEAKTSNNIIAEVGSDGTISKYDIAPIKKSSKKEEDEDERTKDTWFKADAFKDGYDVGDVTKTTLGTVADAGTGVVKGIFNLAEGIVDAGRYGVSGVANLLGAKQYAKDVKETAKENTTDKWFKPIEKYTDKYSLIGDKGDSITQGLGYVGGMIATGGLGGAVGGAIGGTARAAQIGATLATTGTTFASGTGSGMSQAYQGGATDEEAVKYGLIAGAAEAGTELIFGGLGKTIKATGLSTGLSSADDMLAQKVSSVFKSQIAKNIASTGVKMTAEGSEEVLSGIIQAVGQKLTYMNEEELGKLVQDQNLLESFISGAVVSGIAQAPSVVKDTKAGRDTITGYTQNEQSVIDKEVENRIAEREKKGTKLTNKEKSKIHTEVTEDLQKGNISTDTIESVLDGETYKKYKSTEKKLNRFNNEIKSLEEIVDGKKEVDDATHNNAVMRLNTLREEVKKFDTNTLRSQLDSNMADKISSDDYLKLSYDEKGKRTQKFEADLTKYDEKQQKVIQKAVDSGILNDTRKTHEFVDMVAKIAADKDIDFDFTNNQKLKDSGFSVEGKSIDGFVNESGVTLNIQSNKALEKVVGHEITHVLEGTDLYTELQTAVKDYATTKGIWDSRLKEITKRYKNVEDANIENELTSDLVGEYLFTDTDFVNNLSATKPNIFRKIYEEVKYLLKVATAGSKEARQLEKVKHTFEQAYKQSASNKNVEGNKLSITNDIAEKTKQTMENNFKGEKISYIKTSDLNNIEKAGRGNRPAITNEVAQNGITEPLEITINDYGEPKLTDGNHRLEAAIELGLDEVPVRIREANAEQTEMIYKDLSELTTDYFKKNTKYSLTENDINNHKQKQLDIILKENPMTDDYHTGIRTLEDIKTFDETINDDESFVWGDFSQEDAKKALEKGEITVYSSYPIEQGVFVSTSKNQAQDYAGGGKIYSKTVPLTEVAWINGDEGQYAKVNDGNYSLSNQNDIAPTKQSNLTYGEDIELIAPLQEQVEDLSNKITELTNKIDNRLIGQTTTDTDIPYLEQQYNEAPKENIAPLRNNLTEEESQELDSLESLPFELSEAEQERMEELQEKELAPIEDKVSETKALAEVRDYAEVGNRKIKAYQYDNPEVKPYFQQVASDMLYDLDNSQKGERYVVGDISQLGGGDYSYSGQKRFTTPDIAELLDGIDGKYKLSYDQIRKGLENIIEDEGAENNAASKRIEFYIDKRLREGYRTIDGYKIEPNQEYLDTVRRLDILNYYQSIPVDENLIPPVAENMSTPTLNASNTENIAPVRSELKTDDVEATDKGKQLKFNDEEGTIEEEDLVTKTKKELRRALLGTEAQKEFITSALDNAKNRSMALMNNTDTIRNTELVFGRDAGRMINDVIFQKEIDNEADSIAWQNQERDEIKALGIKARSKESAAVQKYGEKQYLNDNGELVAYGDKELASEFKDVKTQEKIKNAAKEIRKKYDNYIDRANEVLTKLGFDPIPKRKDYMRHFQELNDVFSRYGIPFNAKNMEEHVLPTDINGLTENWSPQKNYFASMKPRKGLKTNLDAVTGIDGYISGIANLIYHTEDIQRGRAFEELIRETYGEDKGWDNLDNLPDELKQERADKIQNNHLSNYAAWVHEWTNNVAGKKNKIDRSVESMFGRKAFTVLDETRKQVGSNMIGFNLSSSLTNLIAPVQAMAKTNKLAVLKGTVDTIKNIAIKDNFMNENSFLTSRMGTDMLSKNAWQKMQDAGFIFMKGMDWFSSNQIVRSKYYELRAKGMSEQQAHAEAGKFAARILGDRTKGANAQLYNSKLVGLVTQFQLEVNNQLYSMFYDTYHESKENAKNNALRTAAGMTFTLGQLFAFTHLFGQTFEAIAGYNPTFDVIEMLKTAFGWGDEEDEEKTTGERIKDAIDQLVDALPYVNILTGGGRVPVLSGIPNLVGVATGGKDEYGNELTLEKELKKLLYLVPPTGGNQVKKTTQGLGMFDEKLPVKGSYTDSGNLRYPVEDTPINRAQAAIFGQYANKNAKYYFDNELAPLKEKQIEEYKEMDIPYKDYIKYRSELSKINKTKADKDSSGKAINGTAAAKKAYKIMNGNYSTKEKKQLLEGLSSDTYKVTMSDLNKLKNNEELYKYFFGLSAKGKSDFINAINNYGFDAETLYEVNNVIKNIEDNYSKLNDSGANLSKQKKQQIKDVISQYTTTNAQYNYLYSRIYKK